MISLHALSLGEQDDPEVCSYGADVFFDLAAYESNTDNVLPIESPYSTDITLLVY